jgi:hypothetical protein
MREVIRLNLTKRIRIRTIPRLIKRAGALLLLVGLLGCSGGEAYSYFPKLETPEHLYVIEKSAMSPEELTMVATLQGVVAQKRPEIYINEEAYRVWLEDLQQNYGVKTEDAGDAWALLGKFKDRLKGYIVYEAHTPSVNVATSLAGLKQAVAVEKSLAAKASALGLQQLDDVSGKDDSWLYQQYGKDFSKSIIVQQDPEKGALRDYGVANKAMYYYDSFSSESELSEVYGAMEPDAVRLGWGPGAEFEHIGPATQKGVGTIASDWAMNLTALSAIKPKEAFKQPYHVKAGPADSKAHYVAFVMSDGDNVQWLLNDFIQNEKYYGSGIRGEFPMGWQMAPTLADLAPSALSRIYKDAKKDYFVGGVSGTSYFFPSDYPEEELKTNVKRLESYLEKTDMQITTILDWMSPEKKVLEAYASAKSLKGGILLYGDKYAGSGGKVWWVGDKPFIGAKESLWSTSPKRMADGINGYPADPTKEEGYTIVNVHPWSHTLSDVKTVVDNLDEHVKVVSPEELIERMVRDVKSRTPIE